MIRIGAIKKMWKGWRLLIFAYVSDNSPLKSSYLWLEKCVDGKEYIRIGKGVLHDEERDYPVLRLYVKKWGFARYLFGGKSVVIFGIGKWDEEYEGRYL